MYFIKLFTIFFVISLILFIRHLFKPLLHSWTKKKLRKHSFFYLSAVLVFFILVGCNASSSQPTAQNDQTKAATSTGEQSPKKPTTKSVAKKTTTSRKATADKNKMTSSDSSSSKGTSTKSSTSTSSNTTTSTTKTTSVPAGILPVVVSKNVDGDTIHVNLNGNDETIRMLLIDTPEDVDPRKPIEPYAYTAAHYAATKLPVGKRIYIKEGIEKRDKYQRLLAYVYITPTDMYNEDVVKAGLARVGYIYNDTTYLKPLEADQSYAKSRKLNIWSIPNYVDNAHDTYNMSIACSYAARNNYSTRGCGGNTTAKKTTTSTSTPKSTSSSTTKNKSTTSSSSSSTPKSSTSSSSSTSPPTSYHPSGCNIKGSSSHIYHMPGDAYYARTTHVVQWFCTPQQAENAGYRASKR